jgi:hypothetical protein
VRDVFDIGGPGPYQDKLVSSAREPFALKRSCRSRWQYDNDFVESLEVVD